MQEIGVIAFEDAKSSTVTCVHAPSVLTGIDDEYIRYRKLTVRECERLQTVPDGFFDHSVTSRAQAYKMLGNGWTIDVVAHIFGYLK